MTQRPKMLLVDDDDVFRNMLTRAMNRRGYDVKAANSHEEALLILGDWSPDRAVVDLRMPGPSGLDVLDAIRARSPRAEVVILTGYGSIPTAIEATRRGAHYYVTKPADADEILGAFEAAKGAGSSFQTGEDIKAPSLARVEWEHLQRVLTDCGGNISEAARRLGMHRRSLQRKLQKYPPKT